MSSVMTPRDIQAHLKEIYAVDVLPEPVSRVTDGVKDMPATRQRRPPDPFYPVVFPDALRINIREDSQVVKKAVCLALVVCMNGQKELLGMWIAGNEGSGFRPGVMNELKNRGVKDILLAVADGLTGFPEAVNTAFLQTEVRLCMVHIVRNSCKYVSGKDRKAAALGLKTICLALSEEPVASALEDFAQVREAIHTRLFPGSGRAGEWR
jgi:transposase-like protein